MPDVILWIIEATLNASISDGSPLLVDQRQQYVTRSDRRSDSLDEIFTRLDVVDILEDLFGGNARPNMNTGKKTARETILAVQTRFLTLFGGMAVDKVPRSPSLMVCNMCKTEDNGRYPWRRLVGQ
jgi:hypothetical protein